MARNKKKPLVTDPDDPFEKPIMPRTDAAPEPAAPGPDVAPEPVKSKPRKSKGPDKKSAVSGMVSERMMRLLMPGSSAWGTRRSDERKKR